MVENGFGKKAHQKSNVCLLIYELVRERMYECLCHFEGAFGIEWVNGEVGMRDESERQNKS